MAAQSASQTPGRARVLVLNPNSSEDMTRGVETALEQTLANSTLQVDYYTASKQSPASINNGDDIDQSFAVVNDDLASGKVDLSNYDGVLIACFSVHALVRQPTKIIQGAGNPSLSVTGIFEASISTAQLLLRPYSSETWGIVTTGKFWEGHLTRGVESFLGQEQGSPNSRFAGVFSTGLDAGDFHTVSEEEVQGKLRDATKRLLQSGKVRCIVMGCAGMAGLEKIIRSTATEVLGADEAKQVYVVDGVKAGVLQMEEMLRCKCIFG